MRRGVIMAISGTGDAPPFLLYAHSHASARAQGRRGMALLLTDFCDITNPPRLSSSYANVVAKYELLYFAHPPAITVRRLSSAISGILRVGDSGRLPLWVHGGGGGTDGGGVRKPPYSRRKWGKMGGRVSALRTLNATLVEDER